MIGKAILATLAVSGALAARMEPLEDTSAGRALQQTDTIIIGGGKSVHASASSEGSGKPKRPTPATGSSISCTSKASGGGWKEVYDVHTSAMAEAIAITCEHDPHEDGQAYLYALADAFARDTALIAEAVAKTQASCKGIEGTNGEISGCAWADAFVAVYIDKFVEVHSEAIASVESKCGHCSAGIKLKTRLTASVYERIIYRLTAHSYSEVCVEGTDHAEEFEKCTSTFLAEQFAYAFASAFLDTDCHHSAYGDIEAEADAYVQLTISKKCAYRPPKYY